MKRNHTIVCLDKGAAVKHWFREEGQGPTWSSADVQADGLVYYEGFAAPDGPETLAATRVAWTGTRFEEKPAKVHTIVAGNFAGTSAAREARAQAIAKDASCAPFWILRDDAKSGIFIGAKTTKTKQEFPQWNQWRSCYPALKMVE